MNDSHDRMKPVILSIDDEPKVLDVIRRILENSGFHVLNAHSGQEGLEILKSTKPDLILLDYQMPEMNGPEFCEMIQKNSDLAYIPVVFLTGFYDDQNKAKAFAAGAVDFLAKPVDARNLSQTMIKHIKTQVHWEQIKKDAEPREVFHPPVFSKFKTYLTQKLNLDEQKAKCLETAKCSDIYSLVSDLGIETNRLAQMIAEFCRVPYFSEVYADQIELGVLPSPFCRSNLVIPIRDCSSKSFFVVSNPFNQNLMDVLKARFDSKTFSLGVTDQVTLETLFSNDALAKKETVFKQTQQIEHQEKAVRLLKGKMENDPHPIYVIVQNILESAVSQRASDIHIEPKEGNTIVRFRIDGEMREVFTLKKTTAKRSLSRFKVLANLDIAQSRKPQDGAFTMKINGTEFKLRVATTSTPHGESMIIRLLDPAAKPKSLKDLGMTEAQVEALTEAGNRHHGLILIVGTTGSGKTTTIYSLLFGVDCKVRSLVSVEDPVEYKIPHANQQQVNEKAGVTFESVLKSAMRQDPDILYLGEIRDDNSAKTGIDFASSGHLTITTLHTSNATTAVFRLERLGVPRSSMADTLLAVVAQKLIRKLCDHCKKIALPTAEEAEMFNPYLQKPLEKVARPAGCAQCGGSGYSGREGVYEVMKFDPEIAGRIRKGEAIAEIRNFVRTRGDFLISHHGAMKVQNLTFSPQDVYEKVLAEEPVITHDHEKTVPVEKHEENSEKEKTTQKTASPGGAKPSVLIVDDEKDIRVLLKRLLENRGYEVTAAEDGISALLLMGKQNFDLIISDINMPNLDGFKLLEMKNQKGIDVPVLFLTARTEQENELKGFELGAVDYIKKPIQKEIFVKRIKAALGSKCEKTKT